MEKYGARSGVPGDLTRSSSYFATLTHSRCIARMSSRVGNAVPEYRDRREADARPSDSRCSRSH